MILRKRDLFYTIIFLVIYITIVEYGGFGKIIIEFITEKSSLIKYINEPILNFITVFVPKHIESIIITLYFYISIYFVIKYKQTILDWYYSNNVERLHYEIYYIEYDELRKLIFKIFLVASIQMFYIYNIAVEYGKCSTGKSIRLTYGGARENAVMALFGGGTIANDAGGKALGYEALVVIFFYVFISLFFIKKGKVKIKELFS